MAPSGAATAWSFTLHGAINCAQAIAQCQRVPNIAPGSDVNPLGPAALALLTKVPRLHRVSPSTVPLSGGTRVIVMGSGLSACSGLQIGGVPAASFAVYNDSVATAITAAVNLSNVTALTAFGGANPDGTGAALVQLICKVQPYFRSGSDKRCTASDPCVVSSGFLVNYSAQVSAGNPAVDDDDDVLDSAGFKLLVIAVPVVLIGAGVVAVRRQFAARDAADGEAPISDESDDDGDHQTKSRRRDRKRAPKASRILSMDRPTRSLFGEELAQPLAPAVPLPEILAESFGDLPPPRTVEEDGADIEMEAFTEQPAHPREEIPRADMLL
jgi:hypothetical protein